MKTIKLIVVLIATIVAGTAHADKVVIECIELDDDGKVFNGIKEVLIIDIEQNRIEYVGTPGSGDSLWFHITEASDAEIRAEKRKTYGTDTLTINRYSLQMKVIWDWSLPTERHLDPTWYKFKKGHSRPQL